MKKLKDKTNYITQEQFKSLLDNIPKLSSDLPHATIRLIFECLTFGALRVSELLNLRKSDLMGEGKIKLRETKGGKKNCKCSKWEYRPRKLVQVNKDCVECGGTGRVRYPETAWVKSEVYKKLEKYAKDLDAEQIIFPVSRQTVWSWCQSLAGIHPHTLRHSYLTWMLESEKFNIRDIKQKARHKNLQTTTVYIESNIDVTRKKEEAIL